MLPRCKYWLSSALDKLVKLKKNYIPLFLYVYTLGTWVEVREESAEALSIELRSRARQQAPVLTEPFH